MTPEQWTRVERLYHEAAGIAIAGRRSWLARACGGDEVVRREVEALLAQDASRTGALDGHALDQISPEDERESLVGRQLGGYEFLSLIDEGGMGQVYRARDLTLPRDVAVKVVSPEFTHDAVRRARFRKEAEVLAAFAHPHIAHIYSFLEVDGRFLLAMELVPGESLAERIARGPLPVGEALDIAEQVADAIEAAHEQGVIHRDLKPANIRITPDGIVKVLDFGLAISAGPALATAGAAATRTAPGTLVGTVAYMSPEQARAESVDKRTDIWAFGCVLFEMLTGRKAFTGPTVTDLLAAILDAEPDWSLVPPAVPVPIVALLRRCLDKDRKRRLRDIGEARVALDDEHRPEPTPVRIARPAGTAAYLSPSRRWVLRAAVLIVAALAGAGASIYFGAVAPSPVRQVMRLSIPMTGEAALSLGGFARDLSLTPDGSQLVYVAKNRTQLLARKLGSSETTPIANGTDITSPFVSPDNRWVGYLDGSFVMKKVPITGGASITLAATGRNGATWLSNDTIVYGSFTSDAGLILINGDDRSGDKRGNVLTQPDVSAAEANHWWPHALPGGRGVLFTITAQSGNLDAAKIAVFDLRTRQQKIVLHGGSDARYVANNAPGRGAPGGFLVYVVQGGLRSIPFDLDRLETDGTPQSVNVPVLTSPEGAGDFDIDSAATLMYVESRENAADSPRSLVWVDRAGHERPTDVPPGPYLDVRISPDETRFAVIALEKGERRIWIWDVQRKRFTSRLRFDQGTVTGFPLWTPDGNEIVFQAKVAGRAVSMWRMPADGTGAPKPLATSSNPQMATSFSPDGHLIFHEAIGANLDILHTTLEGDDRRIAPLLHTKSWEVEGMVSPDGRWLAYECCTDGDADIHVSPYPDVQAARWPVSSGGGKSARWSQAGNELFFVGRDGALKSVRFDVLGSVWRAQDTPSRVLPASYSPERGPSGNLIYDVSHDARRILLIKSIGTGGNAPPQVGVLQHLDEELRQQSVR